MRWQIGGVGRPVTAKLEMAAGLEGKQVMAYIRPLPQKDGPRWPVKVLENTWDERRAWEKSEEGKAYAAAHPREEAFVYVGVVGR